MRTWLAVAWVVITGLASLLPSQAEDRRRVVLVVMDGVTWEDYLRADAPALAQIIDEGAVGLMNTRTAGRATREAAYLTLGAGARATADMSAEQAGWCGSADDQALREAAGAFGSRTGTPLGPGALGCWAAPLLREENSLQAYAAVPGLLGQALGKAGKWVACVGNADALAAPRRLAPLIAMDQTGVVPTGFVGEETTLRDSDSPAGFRTDFPEMKRLFHEMVDRADFLVVELGDTGRLAAVGRWVAPDAYLAERRHAIAQADDLLIEVTAALRGTRGRLMIVTPAPVEDVTRSAMSLTPIVVWGEGIPGGLGTSASTRTPGLVTNVDVAPTVLQWLGVGIPEGMIGRPITAIPTGAAEKVRRTLMFHVKHRVLEDIRMPVLHTIAYCMAGMMLLAGLASLLERRSPRWLSWAAKGGLLVLLALVPAMVLAPILKPATAACHTASIALLLAILGALALVLRRTDVPVVLWGIAAAAVLADILLGGRLMRESLLGYSAALGARFYGVGNECAGVLLAGSAALGMALIQRRDTVLRRLLMAAGLGAVCLAVGHPALGANLGMAAATAVCFGTALYLAWPIRRRGLAAALLISAVVLVLAAAIWVDVMRLGAAQSHIGRAFQGGWAAIFEVATRKIAKNFMLLRNSPWTWPLVASASVLIALVLAQPEGFLAALRRRRLLGATTTAVALGAAAALILNDSGVVPAALSLFFAAAAACYWVVCTEG